MSIHPIPKPMHSICLMKNVIQPYHWGSHSAIAKLLGQPIPSQKPQAELWMGAHPKGPSQLRYQGRWQPLDRLILQYPEEMLGPKIFEPLGQHLPFLFKVLAAAQPLSIQAHPNRHQARVGFEREDKAGIPVDAPHRNYRDAQHKPEILCAVTPFSALCGFRPVSEMMMLMGPVWPPDQARALTILTRQGIKFFFKHLMSMPAKSRTELVESVVRNASQSRADSDVAYWIQRLAEVYPHDIGVIFPLLLHLVHLSPGQAIYLPAGQLHAYLEGTGVELMANSDNVLRGGLTSKHVDVPELLEILDFAPRPVERLVCEKMSSGECAYPSSVSEFKLSVIALEKGTNSRIALAGDTPEILFCTSGGVGLRWPGSEAELTLSQGRSAFIPASVTRYEITGSATLYRATVNL